MWKYKIVSSKIKDVEKVLNALDGEVVVVGMCQTAPNYITVLLKVKPATKRGKAS